MKDTQVILAVCIILTAVSATAAILLIPGAFETPTIARVAWIAGLEIAALGFGILARRLRIHRPHP